MNVAFCTDQKPADVLKIVVSNIVDGSFIQSQKNQVKAENGHMQFREFCASQEIK
jgi:hypothetical protein